MSRAARLASVVVAIIARSGDEPAVIARPLLEAGATVVICADWTPYYGHLTDEEVLPMVRLSLASPERAVFLTAVDGCTMYDLLPESDGPARFVRWIRRAFGRLDAVIIGFETGLADVAAQTLTTRLRRTGGEVIVFEGRALAADGLVRQFGGAAPGPETPTVLRWHHGRPRRPVDGLGPVARVLIIAGVAGRPTIAAVRRVAAQRRRSGDPIAGLLWTQIGWGDHDHGGTAFVTARSLARAAPITELSWPDEVTYLGDLGLDGFIVPDDNGIAEIEAAMDGEVAVAVRVGTLSDSFDHDDPYVEMGDWSPFGGDPGEIMIGDPWAVIADREGWPIRLARAPVWHVDHAMAGAEMIGMRLWCDLAPTVAARRRD